MESVRLLDWMDPIGSRIGNLCSVSMLYPGASWCKAPGCGFVVCLGWGPNHAFEEIPTGEIFSTSDPHSSFGSQLISTAGIVRLVTPPFFAGSVGGCII